MDPNWRPTEWNPDIWLFTGDPDNPATVLARCRTQACSATLIAQGLCTSCRKEYRSSGLSLDEFVATHVPVRSKRYPTFPQPRCIVDRDGQRCSGWSHCKGLCVPHYSQWRAALQRCSDLHFDDWIAAVAVPRVGTEERCVVAGCELERFRGSSLCFHHYYKHRREDPEKPVQQWLLTQTPYLHGQHFSLGPLPATVRLEVLYALQQRDARGDRIDPALVRRLVKHVASLPSLMAVTGGRRSWAVSLTSSRHLQGLLVGVLRDVQAGHDHMLGVAPTDRQVWDSSVIKLPTESDPGAYRYGKSLDFTTLSQNWLRVVALEWARRTDPPRDRIREAMKAGEIASATLERRGGGGHDPTALGFDDVEAIVNAIRNAKNEDAICTRTPTGGP